MKDNDNIRGVTLRVAIFFGLTTFTLCIGIFYIEAVLDDTRDKVEQRDSTIVELTNRIQLNQVTLEEQSQKINSLELKLEDLGKDQSGSIK